MKETEKNCVNCVFLKVENQAFFCFHAEKKSVSNPVNTTCKFRKEGK